MDIHVCPYNIHIYDICNVLNFVQISMHLIRSIALHKCVYIIHLIAFHSSSSIISKHACIFNCYLVITRGHVYLY